MNIKVNKILLLLVLIFWSFFSFNISEAWFFSDLAEDQKAKSPYCQWDWDCSLSSWIAITKWWINDIEKDQKASEYIQSMVWYVLKFISIVAVIYIIYAWFSLLTSAWDEEKQKKTKNIIVFVIIWIIVIWLASPILVWLINVLNQST